ncbi:oligosaccharide flippase family protein [Flavonifractor sp. An100]|uniref:oligosaccharide flippase family protein n=1 Tax=Flavonifractor sp. An100 TaxID=1965538 RepID=UPI000B3A6C45|nr:oligosaccharide flippase family protein [Flavonifractor sp. An100]OUQ79819.1 hypothetical protein B5E43_05295 [Flavonifractor sp. An100]
MDRKTGVILSYVLMIFEVCSTLLLTPFIIRTLGQAEYGVYKLSASVVAYLLLLDLGVGNSIIRFIAKYRVTGEKDQARKFLGVATIYYLIVGIIALIAGFVLIVVFPSVFAKGLTENEIILGQKLLAITMLNSAVTLGTAAYNNVIIAFQQFAVSKVASIVQILIRMLLTVVVLKCGMGSLGIVSVNLLMTVLVRAFFVLYVLIKIKLVPRFTGIELGFIKEIVAYSSLILLQMVATQINASVDQILIGSLVTASTSILAVYSVGTQVTQYFQSIGSAFTGVLMPGVVALVECGAEPEKLTAEMIRVGRIILIVLGIIWGGFLVCGKQFIELWAGGENSEAYVVAVILMSAYLFTLTESIGSQILWAKNQHREQAILKIVIVLINIILTVFLIQWEPLIGATIGTFISLMLGDVLVMNLIFVIKLKINLRHYYLSLFKGLVPSIIIAIVVGSVFKMLMPNVWLGLISNILLMCIVYGVAMMTIGMNTYEKHLIFSILQKLWIKRSK